MQGERGTVIKTSCSKHVCSRSRSKSESIVMVQCSSHDVINTHSNEPKFLKIESIEWRSQRGIQSKDEQIKKLQMEYEKLIRNDSTLEASNKDFHLKVTTTRNTQAKVVKESMKMVKIVKHKMTAVIRK